MKKLVLFFLIMLFSNNFFGQNKFWQKTEEGKILNLEKFDRRTIPTKYDLYSLDFDTFRQVLQTAPERGNALNFSNVVIEFPNPNGAIEKYRIYEASVMHPSLQAQFPEMRSYIGVGIDDTTAMIRFSVTLFGLHAMTFSNKTGVSYIDTYSKDLKSYIVYSRSDLINNSTFNCLVEDNDVEELPEGVHFSPRNSNSTQSNTGIFRTYRLAMACTIEYAQYHWQAAGMTTSTPVDTRKTAVLAAMNVSMTRINGVYEREMSLTMELVPDNLNIIFITSDNFNNTNAGTLINQSQTVIDGTIGFDNYDIGHTVSTGGGGLAQLNSPCTTNKARGITGSPAPVGDPFDIDYVAHEMGHQFGATHTFNNSCNNNRTNATAVEPGSGSTIMAYAGICSPNVQNNSDAYFHAVSLAQMDAFVAGTGNCSVNNFNNNSAPIISPISNYTIPISTAFELTASVTDIDGDVLTYCWEQTNNGISTQPPTAGDAVNGPRFRSRNPSTSPNRFFPAMTTILSGLTANTWEVIPSTAKVMNFALTVRDNKLVVGGQTSRANMTVTTVAAAGPFVVTAPNTNVSWSAGSNQNVTWNVAGTTANGVDTPYVDIYLSTNGGSTFPILLASQVPNDGSEVITVPNIVGSQNRIMVKGHNNIFLDVSNTNFTITSASSPTMAIGFNGVLGEQNKTICQGSNATFSINFQALAGFSANTTFGVVGNPSGTNVTFTPNTITSNGTVVMEVTNTSAITPNLYQLIVTATSGAITKTANFYLNIVSSNFSSISLLNPANGATVYPNSVSFAWSNISALAYDIEIATTSDFINIIASGEATTNTFNFTNLPNSTTLYWRVRPKNQACQGSFSSIYSFNTNFCGSVPSTNIPIAIPLITATVESIITIPANQSVTIADINVTMDISHTWINDLRATLISPNNTQVILFNRPCTNTAIPNVIATFDDAGATLVCGTNPGISGIVKPSQVLSAFNGQASSGVWTLRVQDFVADDGGSINSWSIDICSLEAPLNTIDNQIADFNLYPNPNNGTFNIQFTTSVNSEVKLAVFDSRGRKIYDKSFLSNNILFNESISIREVQSGIYFVNIQDGQRNSTKKIIIK